MRNDLRVITLVIEYYKQFRVIKKVYEVINDFILIQHLYFHTGQCICNNISAFLEVFVRKGVICFFAFLLLHLGQAGIFADFRQTYGLGKYLISLSICQK